MLPVINGLYLNAQYAEIPPAEIKKVVDICYRPVLESLLKRKDKFIFSITGYSIELLQKEYPDIIELIKKLIEKGNFEIVGSSYSNPVLALLPQESKERQIKAQLDLVKKVFKVKPTGFHLPEFSWDPTLSDTLKKFGIKWTIILQHQIDFSKRPNEFAVVLGKRPNYSADVWKKVATRSIPRKILTLPKIQFLFNKELKITDHEPFYIHGVNDEIIGFKTIKTWTGFAIAASGNRALQTQTKLISALGYQSDNGRGLFMPFFADIENINIRGNSPIKFTLANFETYLDYIKRNKQLGYRTPSEYLNKRKINNHIYIKTSSGEPSGQFDMWHNDPDSMRLESLCHEIREKLDHLKNRLAKTKIEKLLMIAESGDGRGWNPVPERKIESFQAAIEALKLLS